MVDDIPLDEVFRFVNEVALIRGQWQVRKGKMKEEEYRALLDEKVFPNTNALKAAGQAGTTCFSPRWSYGYFPCQSEGDDLIVYRGRQEDRATAVHVSPPDG